MVNNPSNCRTYFACHVQQALILVANNTEHRHIRFACDRFQVFIFIAELISAIYLLRYTHMQRPHQFSR